MFVTLVSNENRHIFEDELRLMFKQRYTVFVQNMGWDLPLADHKSEIEKDQFDNEDAIYLLLQSKEGRLLGSLRFIPTNKPHLFSELFNHLIDGDVPKADDIWECSRFYVMSRRGGSTGFLGRGGAVLGAAMFEAALQNGVTEMTTLASHQTLPMILNSGAIVTPIGIPQPMDDGFYTAISVQATQLGLKIYRERRRISGPVLLPVERKVRISA